MRNIIKIGLLCSLSCVYMPPKFYGSGRVGSDSLSINTRPSIAQQIAAERGSSAQIAQACDTTLNAQAAALRKFEAMRPTPGSASSSNLNGSQQSVPISSSAARLLQSPQEEARRRIQEQLEQVRSAHQNRTTLREQDALLRNTDQLSRAIAASSSGLSRGPEELIQNLINDGISREDAVQVAQQSYSTQSDEAMYIYRTLAEEMGLPDSDLATYREILSLRLDEFMKLCALIQYDPNVLMHLTPKQANDLLDCPTILSQAAS